MLLHFPRAQITFLCKADQFLYIYIYIKHLKSSPLVWGVMNNLRIIFFVESFSCHHFELKTKIGLEWGVCLAGHGWVVKKRETFICGWKGLLEARQISPRLMRVSLKGTLKARRWNGWRDGRPRSRKWMSDSSSSPFFFFTKSRPTPENDERELTFRETQGVTQWEISQSTYSLPHYTWWAGRLVWRRDMFAED